MIEKPDLSDVKITAALRAGYAIAPRELEFLPLGNDSSAWVYRVTAADGAAYFLKVKKGAVYQPALSVPRCLQDLGITQVVAPLSTTAQTLWVPVDDFALILYSYIHGDTGMAQGLTDAQWIEFGRVLKQIHTTRLPDALTGQVQRETFIPKWSGMVRTLHERVQQGRFSHPLEKELAAFWLSRSAEIAAIVTRAEALGRTLRRQCLARQPQAFVLCHTDIHTANLLIDPRGDLHIVDWDQPLLAPIERDLMFVVGTEDGQVSVGGKAQQLFLSGYGPTAIDPLGIAYYQYEWVVQEIGDYGERVFLMPNLGEETKAAAVQGLMQLFDPGDVVETAYHSGL